MQDWSVGGGGTTPSAPLDLPQSDQFVTWHFILLGPAYNSSTIYNYNTVETTKPNQIFYKTIYASY